jgi:hypothetical protein
MCYSPFVVLYFENERGKVGLPTRSFFLSPAQTFDRQQELTRESWEDAEGRSLFLQAIGKALESRIAGRSWKIRPSLQ